MRRITKNCAVGVLLVLYLIFCFIYMLGWYQMFIWRWKRTILNLIWIISSFKDQSFLIKLSSQVTVLPELSTQKLRRLGILSQSEIVLSLRGKKDLRVDWETVQTRYEYCLPSMLLGSLMVGAINTKVKWTKMVIWSTNSLQISKPSTEENPNKFNGMEIIKNYCFQIKKTFSHCRNSATVPPI